LELAASQSEAARAYCILATKLNSLFRILGKENFRHSLLLI
jgi:hypothetical protein